MEMKAMNETMASRPYQIIWLIRRLFRALGQRSNESLEAFGVTAAERAVMEFLYPSEELSVPEIAARYQVSRQHIQVNINALTERGLVGSRENPRHKRSPLMLLEARGRALFEKILRNDAAVIENLFSGIPEGDLNTTRNTLQALLNELNGE